MSDISFRRISKDGDEPHYDLYVRGECQGHDLSMEQVIQIICESGE